MTTVASTFIHSFNKAFAESPRRFFSPLLVFGLLASRSIGRLLRGGHRR